MVGVSWVVRDALQQPFYKIVEHFALLRCQLFHQRAKSLRAFGEELGPGYLSFIREMQGNCPAIGTGAPFDKERSLQPVDQPDGTRMCQAKCVTKPIV